MEDTEEWELAHNFKFKAELDSDQTGAVMHLDPKKMLVSFGCGFFEDDDPLIFIKRLSIPPCPTARRSIQDAPVTAGIMLKNPSRPRGGDNGQSGNQGNGDGDQQPLPNANPPEKKPKVVPVNRKAASKVSSLSSKITDVRCLTTQLENSNLFLGFAHLFIFLDFLSWRNGHGLHHNCFTNIF